MPNSESKWDVDYLVKLYQRSYATHGNSPAAVQWPRGRQDLRFDALTSHIKSDGFSLLDFGCGLAHLKKYLDTKYSNFHYHGVDIVPEFISACSQNYPDASFDLMRGHADVAKDFDHVVISGTFNLVYGTDVVRHRTIVRETLVNLFQRTRVALAVNFMTDRVDYHQEHSYHENVANLYEFACNSLSPRLTLDQSYMPFEFTMTIFKDREIVRPDNIYRPR